MAIFGCQGRTLRATCCYQESPMACSQRLYTCLQGKAAMVMYAQFEKDRDRNDFSLLPELHSILSGMKVGRGGAILCSLSANPACPDCSWETSVVLPELLPISLYMKGGQNVALWVIWVLHWPGPRDHLMGMPAESSCWMERAGKEPMLLLQQHACWRGSS